MSRQHPYTLPGRARAHVHLFALGVILAYAWGRLLEWASLSVPWWVDDPGPFAAYGAALLVIDRWAWPRLHWLVGAPDLRGRWTGSVRSSRDGHEVEHPVEVHIRQTWSSMVLVLETAGSRSESIAAHVLPGTGAEAHELTYEYENRPKPSAAGTMRGHRGLARLRLSADGQRLAGDYFTDGERKTEGELVLTRVRC